MTRKTHKAVAAKNNPLAKIRIGTEHETADAKAVVAALIEPKNGKVTDHHDVSTMGFLVGVVLFTLRRAPDGAATPTLSDAAWSLTSEDGIERLYVAMKENKDGPNRSSHRTIAAAAIDMLEREDRERGSVLSSAKAILYPYRN